VQNLLKILEMQFFPKLAVLLVNNANNIESSAILNHVQNIDWSPNNLNIYTDPKSRTLIKFKQKTQHISVIILECIEA